MRENRMYGSEGGETGKPVFPTPIEDGPSQASGFRFCLSGSPAVLRLAEPFCYHRNTHPESKNCAERVWRIP
jgi:hypothetical protein